MGLAVPVRDSDGSDRKCGLRLADGLSTSRKQLPRKSDKLHGGRKAVLRDGFSLLSAKRGNADSILFQCSYL